MSAGGTGRNYSGSTGEIQFASNTGVLTSSVLLSYDITSGRLGVGTSGPGDKVTALTLDGVDVNFRAQNANSLAKFGIDYSGNLQIYAHTGKAQIFYTNGGVEQMRITSAGNVGIGTSSPDALLTVNTTASFGDGASGTPSIAHKGDLTTGLWFPTANVIAVSTSGTERWRIDSGGGLSSRTAFASGLFALSIGVSGAYPVDRGIAVSNSAGSAIPFIAYTSNTTQAGYIVTSGSTIAFVQGSDHRLKENVVDMDKSETLSKLMEVRPVDFDWKDGNTLHNYGFLAHELQEVFPQAVHGEKDAVNEDGSIKTQSVNLAALIPYLVASIQKQQTIINDLKTRIETLEGK